MTKLYHVPRDGYQWLVAITNGKRFWLYAKGKIGDCIR